ncbi:hypothetical protein CVS40_4077 [Lucilia cuprina]|nr:hypothetical protein CVS40_4077 [Lucilia cuprina]KAI8125989.1 hypothetical protein CVS40_4077 [Lucilia cuprina]
MYVTIAQFEPYDIVFSSKRSADEDNQNPLETNNTNTSTTAGEKDKDKTPQGGLSVTGCLADFNVYIFHPYGGKKTNIKEAQFSPLTDSERKDSLSINVEFVKFHITRCRKVYIEPSTTSSAKRPIDQSKAVVRFSTIVDIGSASFKYDMRRLTEILAFPKAWYRRRIVRRLFLGDLSVQQSNDTEHNLGTPTTPKDGTRTKTPDTTKSPADAFYTRDKLKLNFDSNNQTTPTSSTGATRKLKNLGKSSSNESSSTPPSEKNQITAWETLVLFAVNFTKLNVQMNMGNVMGNVVWLTKDFQSDGRLSIGSTGYKNMYIGIYLGGSSLDAKGGIVGGSFEVNKINTRFHIKEESGVEPYHTMGLSFMALELRLDYMGTSVLMTRISSFSAAMKDEWKTSLQQQGGNISPPHDNTAPKAIIFIHGDLSWDQLQIMISKSTTADLLKMYYKLEEFFTQQFKSSKRVFSSLEPRLHERNASMKRRQRREHKKSINGASEASGVDLSNTDARHHRHWQKPLEMVAGLVVPTLVTRLPRNGNVLGGSVELHGNNISLACFHGINFKSKSWALFSLKSPFINFTTEAHQDSNSREVFVTQTLTSCLGQTSEVQQQNHSMAIVSRITRNIVFPPQFKTLNEWFHYAFANSEIDAVDRFPILECDREIASNSIERARGASSTSSSKSQDREVIFALPSLHLHFKTEHKQGPTTPLQTADTKPEVVCSFTTEFDDHIFVTVDADAFFFLHDLITSYVKEKEKVVGAQSVRAASPNLSQNIRHQLKPYVSEEITKEQQMQQQQQQQSSTTSSASNTLSSKHASSQNLDVNQLTANMTTTTTHLTNSNHNLNNDTKDSSSKTSSNININSQNSSNTNITATNANANDNKPASNNQGAAASTNNPAEDDNDLESFFRDWRHFECQTWHLEPTVRILYWAGKSIEPYGIDYILNKLGFSHARTTIPKWLQRGFMDPLDKVQALMMLQLLSIIRENKQEPAVKNNKNSN